MRVVPIGQNAEPILTPDLIWDGSIGDLVIDQDRNDLRAARAIETAVLICLQTDRRVDPSELPSGETNRGWPGDAFDLQPGEGPLGSKLWLLRRRAVSDDLEMLASDYAREAMQTLIDQGVAARVDVSATADPSRNRLDLDIALYGRDGATVFQQRFSVLWDQLNGV